MKRRNLLKLCITFGAGAISGAFINKDEESPLIEKITNEAYKKVSLTPLYYESRNDLNKNITMLQQNDSCDVCIIGGGLTGVSTAFNLAQAGYKVILLEAGHIGGKASGLNGGQVLTSYECGMDFLSNKYGVNFSKQLWDLSLLAVNSIKKNITEHNIKCDWQSGSGIVAYKKKHMDFLEEEINIIKNIYGYEHIQLFNKEQTEAIIASDKYYGLLYDNFSGHMHPLNYVIGMANACRKYPNINFYEYSKATSIKFNKGGQHLITVNNQHQIKANFIVLACNYQNSDFISDLSYKVAKFDTYVMATEKLTDGMANDLIKNRMCVFDSRHIMNYYRLTADNHIIFGGGDTFGKADIKKTQAILYKELIDIFPQLAGIKVKNFWYGSESITLNMAPNFGRYYDTVYYAQGYSGQGLALSNLAGIIMADAIRGQSERFDLFNKITPPEITDISMLKNAMIKMGVYYFHMKDFFS